MAKKMDRIKMAKKMDQDMGKEMNMDMDQESARLNAEREREKARLNAERDRIIKEKKRERDRIIKARKERTWAEMSQTLQMTLITIIPVCVFGAMTAFWTIEKLADQHRDISLLLEFSLRSFVMGVIACSFSQIFFFITIQKDHAVSLAEYDEEGTPEIIAARRKFAKYAAYSEKWALLSVGCLIGGILLLWGYHIFNFQALLDG